jgi:predicted metal-binding membrane protein
MLAADGAMWGSALSRRPESVRGSRRAFLGIAALLFVGSAAMTVASCTSMSAMGELPMPGGWKLSMVWMRMPGSTWLDAGASFLCMWIVMMIAMMLPSVAPKLLRDHSEIHNSVGAVRAGLATGTAAVAYLLVWAVFGAVVYPVGVAITAIELQQPMVARAVPVAAGAAVLIGGLLQFTKWKMQQLECCHGSPGSLTPIADARAAFQRGVRMGIDCSKCCLGFVGILLSVGIMDLRAMTIVTAAITLERLAPAGALVARVTGALAAAFGMLLIARAGGTI